MILHLALVTKAGSFAQSYFLPCPIHSLSTNGSSTSSISIASPEGSLEDVRTIAQTCERLVEDMANGRCSMEEFGDALRATGIPVEAAGDYIEEVCLRLERQLEEPNQPVPSSSTTTAETCFIPTDPNAGDGNC
jgi:hypothetical protein